jgi:hydrogenase expression/formation protein HypE
MSTVSTPASTPPRAGPGAREQDVLDRIDRARRRKPRILEERVTLAHGAGGKATHSLIEAIFVDALANPTLEQLGDAAGVTVGGERLAFTTDSFVVSPIFFPGGSIGDLAVNGTVNDLSVSGAVPICLSLGLILEEGFPVADLRRVVADIAAAAKVAGVEVVTGDTKVVQRGKGDGCYINTSGLGRVDGSVKLGPQLAEPGDVILVSGPIGDHGMTIMIARGELEIESEMVSDTAPLRWLVADLMAAAPGLRWMRDATRGGVATVLNELAKAAGVSVVLDELKIPVRPAVVGACELLGIDPLYAACEGRLVAVVASEDAEAALAAMRQHACGEGAAQIGVVKADPPGLVLLKTEFGGSRIVDLLVGDPLPRIC